MEATFVSSNKKKGKKLPVMTARGNKHAFTHMAGRRARGTHAEIQSQCNSLITRAYWP